MKLICGLLFALAAWGQCTTTPCSFSTNIAWTTQGTKDPNFWGNLASVTTQIPFSAVPKGYSVQILHVSGDQVAGIGPNGKTVANGTVYAGPYTPCIPAPDSMGYVLFSLTNTTKPNEQFSPLEQGAGFLFHQLEVPRSGSRAAFDSDVVPNALLNSDNILNANQAMFLNATGCPIHMELSLVLTFKYVLSMPVAKYNTIPVKTAARHNGGVITDGSGSGSVGPVVTRGTITTGGDPIPDGKNDVVCWEYQPCALIPGAVYIVVDPYQGLLVRKRP